MNETVSVHCAVRTEYLNVIWVSSSSSVGPVVNATDVLQPEAYCTHPIPTACLNVPTFADRCPPTTREILVVKVGTMLARINRKLCLRLRLSRHFRDLFYVPQICDMGPTALLPFRRNGLLRIFFFALKNPDGFRRVSTGDRLSPLSLVSICF